MTNPQSYATFPSELDSSDALWDQMLRELQQEWGTRELVSLALRDANNAFVAQFTEPDGHKFMDACDRFGDFLAFNSPMSYADQKMVIQILQVACAMHENALSSPVLSPTDRSTHQLASSSLVSLLKKAFNGPINFNNLRCDLEALYKRAREALARSVEALDISKFLDFSPSMLGDPTIGAQTRSGVTGPVAEPPAAAGTPAKRATEASRTSRPVTRSITKERAREMFNHQTHRQLPTRTQSMPMLSFPTTSSGSSRTSRTPFRVHPRGGNGLGSLSEAVERE